MLEELAGGADSLGARARAYQPGRSLERNFYTSDEAYRLDIEYVWCENWIWAGHTSQIPASGDFFLFSFGSESIIIVRDAEGDVRAHLNVCRHRGSRVCLENAGTARAFSCPYHGWTYSLDGSLRAGRMMGEEFKREDHGLLAVHIEVFEGLIFVNLSEKPSALGVALDRLKPFVAPFDIVNTKVAATRTYPVPANWKLAVENYLECYHCAPAHADYSRSHSLKDPASITDELLGAMRQKADCVGMITDEISETGADATPPGVDIYYRRYPLYPGYVTGAENGKALAPLLGHLTGYDGGASDIQVGPLSYFLAYSDHVVGYQFLPRSALQTDIVVTWMVRGDAVESVDYDVECLTWLWDVTSKDDERIIRHNQDGVNSIRYQPGPLSEMEDAISDFLAWYTAQIRV